MKRALWPILILLLSILAWWSTIYISPFIAQKALVASGQCDVGNIVTCKEVLAILGTTGDMFGAVTSLFSGLALFAVAYTLWSDTDARREARKPMIQVLLSADSILMRNPSPHPHVGINFLIDLTTVNKTNEVALNIILHCSISVKGSLVKRERIELPQPLTSQGAEEHSIELRLEGAYLTSILGALTEDNSCVEFSFDAHFNSLENVKWSTRATYELTCKSGDARKKLNSLRSDTDDYTAQWDNGAAVALNPKIRAGSWSHKRL